MSENEGFRDDERGDYSRKKWGFLGGDFFERVWGDWFVALSIQRAGPEGFRVSSWLGPGRPMLLLKPLRFRRQSR